MPKSISELRGVSKDLGTKLEEQGITNTDELLRAAKTSTSRAALAKTAGVDTKVILELANKADLSRIQGVAGSFSDLLEEAGVDTVKELGNRVPENLHDKLETLNKEKKIAGRTPSTEMIADWVSQARSMPSSLEY
ncbi:MAG: DUF4332 domain-containing protein [Chloroflexi bacterium]|nr:DUF4332 domain-containing protein [Chloroflexota bacterium]